ncbi:MAG: hypothetical protein IPK37_04280 [Austwickia sp.]|nr:MAG: hypothetical protein IPK37_04280 [Austwickia sp.]
MSETREDVPGEARETVSVELYKYHYLLYRDELLRAATAFEAAVKDALDRAAIPCHSVEARAKTHSSFTVKADRRIGERYKYADPLSEVKDCIAARVIVFTTEARSQAVSELGKAFTVSVVENPGERTCNGYDSDHLEISGLSADVRERYKDLDWFFTTWYEGARAEIQVRTVAGHAWAEYEHDVRYKPSGYLDLDATRRTKVDQLFIEAGGFRREIDRRFAEVDEQ